MKEGLRTPSGRAILLAVPSCWWTGWMLWALFLDDDLTAITWGTVAFISICSAAFYVAAMWGSRGKVEKRNVTRALSGRKLWVLFLVVTGINGFFAYRAVQMYTIYGALIRQAVFEYNGDLFFSTWLHVIYTLTIYPMTVALVMYAATLGVFRTSLGWLTVGLGSAALADLVYFGRFNLYTFFLSLAFAACVRRFRHGKARGGMVVLAGATIILIAGYMLISNARDGNLLRFNGKLYTSQISRYHTIGIHLFDKQLTGERLSEYKNGYGRCTFGVIDLGVGLLIRRFGSSYEPFSRAVDYERQTYVNISSRNGEDAYVNAFYTGFSSLLLDFGTIGAVVATAVLGIWFGRVYRLMISSPSMCSAALFVYLGVMFMRFIFNSPLEAPFFWPVACLIWYGIRWEDAAPAKNIRKEPAAI